MSRSEASREVSVTTSSASTPSGRAPVRSTRTPPCGLISFSVAVALTRPPAPRRGRARRACPARAARSPPARAPRCRARSRRSPAPRTGRDAGELLDLAGERLRVEALDVAPGALVDRRVDEHLDERRVLLDHLAGLLPRLLVGRDRRDDHGGAGAREARGDPADPLDVGVPVLLREAEALREVRADDVAVEVLDDQAAPLELGPDVVGDRRLAGPGEAREPQGEAAAGYSISCSSVYRRSSIPGECRTRACPSRPSGRPAPPRRARSAGCRECSRSSGSRRRAAGCRESR